MRTRTVAMAMAASVLIAGCSAQPERPPQPRPQQSGQPMDPLRTATRMAGVQVGALTGDQAVVQGSLHAMHEDMRRAIKLADPSRPINPEAARGIARAIPGVRSANWIDRNNLLVRVDRAHLRSHQTIDVLCVQLEPLGDTLAVVVHVQDAAPGHRDGMDTLSRNCQLVEGDHSMFQRARTVNVLDPGDRVRHRSSVEHMQRGGTREQSAGDRAALEAMAEM